MEIPNEASWMIRKILNMREYLGTTGDRRSDSSKNEFQIIKYYKNMRKTSIM